MRLSPLTGCQLRHYHEGCHSLTKLVKLIASLILPLILFIPAGPALSSPGTLKWSVVDTPNSAGHVIASPSEINAIGIGRDGRTIYAVDSANGRIYKSMNGGSTWDNITSQLTRAGAMLPAWNIAIAPDNQNFIAVVTSTGGLPRNVFVSADGGASWQNTNCPVTSNISAIDISPSYSGYDIAVGTRTAAGGGDVYIFKAVGQSNWKAQGFTGDILAVKFSPSYRTDSSVVVVSTHATGTYVNIGIRDTAANTTTWGTWGPVEVTTTGSGTSPKAHQVITADVELPADFSGQAPSLRRCYVSIDDAGVTGNAGIYRLDDSVVHVLMPGAAQRRISSIAYYGSYASGKLLAGEVLGGPASASVVVWFTDAPVTCPEPCWYQTHKAPTGGGNSGYANAQVAWSPEGSRAYCATSSASLVNPASWPSGYLIGTALDESALSLSLDNGKTWNQLSLIDTEISFLADVAVTPASDAIYLASINNHPGVNNFDSIWRSTSVPPGRIWERVLCVISTSNDLILRHSGLGDDGTIYFASRFTGDLRQSQDKGQTWSSLLPGVNISDFAVSIINNMPHLYVLNNNYVRRGTGAYGAWQWAPAVNTTLSTGHSITATSTGVIVVGDDGTGEVAFSLDGGVTFHRKLAIPEPGKMHAIADYRFRNTLIIYAASDSPNSGIYCWVVGSNFGWAAMKPPGRSFYGLAQLGTLYGAWSSGGNTAVDRTLEPEKLAPPFIEWDCLTASLPSGVIFTREPVSLKVSAGINLWAIDNRPYTVNTGRLWNFYDCLSPSPQHTPPPPPDREVLFQAPIPTSPAMDETIPVYIETGDIGDIVFKWRHPTRAIEYDLWLAKDSSFTKTILKESINPGNREAPGWILPKTTRLEKGAQYYWKVRVSQAATGEKGEGEWSKVMSFSVAALEPEETVYAEPVTSPPQNSSTRKPAFLSRLTNLPLPAWIAIVLLLVAASTAAIIVSRLSRKWQ